MARGRGKLTPQDIEAMKIFSNNLNRILSERNLKQIDLSRGTQIPPSTLTGYVKGTSLPIPGNVQKIADFLGILKSDIDPRFSDKEDQPQPDQTDTVAGYTSDDLKQMAAGAKTFDGKPLTDDDIDAIQSIIEIYLRRKDT